MILAVASGKGGTGKTTVATNLARAQDVPVLLLDCDVEEPNVHLFVHGEPVNTETVSLPVPLVDAALCDGCNACGEFCAYNAIVSFGKAPLIFPDMCHGCGGCMKVCPKGAISEQGKRIGVVETLRSGAISVVQGCLDVGVAMAPPLIRAVKRHVTHQCDAILDAPPGTSCPVIATLRDVDFTLLVTEPTPFGLHDLTLAVDVLRELAAPFGVVVNRMGVGDDRVHRYCDGEHIPLLLEIPDDRRIAEAYSRGELMVDALPEYRLMFRTLFEQIKTDVQGMGKQ